jgi:hypothetical protein
MDINNQYIIAIIVLILIILLNIVGCYNKLRNK